jgi:hypothetical protein
VYEFNRNGCTKTLGIRTRWHESWKDENGNLVPAIKDLKYDNGNMLNKAIAAIEDSNDALAGVHFSINNSDAGKSDMLIFDSSFCLERSVGLLDSQEPDYEPSSGDLYSWIHSILGSTQATYGATSSATVLATS